MHYIHIPTYFITNKQNSHGQLVVLLESACELKCGQQKQGVVNFHVIQTVQH